MKAKLVHMQSADDCLGDFGSSGQCHFCKLWGPKRRGFSN